MKSTDKRPSETYLKLARIVAPERSINPQSAQDFLDLRDALRNPSMSAAFPTAARYDKVYEGNLGYFDDGFLYFCNDRDEILFLHPYRAAATTLFPVRRSIDETYIALDGLVESAHEVVEAHPDLQGLTVLTHAYCNSVDHLVTRLFSQICRTGDRPGAHFGMGGVKEPGLYAALADAYGLDALSDTSIAGKLDEAAQAATKSRLPRKTDLLEALRNLLASNDRTDFPS
ncbi:MAG: hypothetical protein Q4B69_04780 [Slackia sp.]|nr:hypothetical protein [Slackia sp.]